MNVVENGAMTNDVGRLSKAVADGRKDGLLIDCARLVATHYGKMVEHFSTQEGRPIAAHNNKTLFLEGLDYWCRAIFTGQNGRSGTTEDPKEVILAIMEPWYEAMEQDDPAKFKMSRRIAVPAYVGSQQDAIGAELGMLACLDVTPIQLRYGVNGVRIGSSVSDVQGKVWGRVQADGKWYDTDPMEAGFGLGNFVQHDRYEDVEIPL